MIFGSGTRLTVQPREESKTEAFILGSDQDNKDGKARACLITDFSSHNISVTLGDETFDADPSVIKGDKQYSVVAFLSESKDRSDFNCRAAVNGSMTVRDSKDKESVCESDVAYVFESDEKLNSLSLVVLGLRVIFLKSIAFNVLMTIRAWMS
ncbi:M1-specific T cell receptor alpha chain-like [Polyodon spathula]|uniref:M1-specific T cell receptor alpha chain-like n=1 Tax=Polyodon spathula TaxID=7913 RepID=UPI001B7F0F02|nr:M1-specific T cell receptor alpha chain-like [Polyodon spathula]